MKHEITPERIAEALGQFHHPLNGNSESLPLSRRRLAEHMGLKSKTDQEELGRMLKAMWPRQYEKYGVSFGYYPTGWRVRLPVTPCAN